MKGCLAVLGFAVLGGALVVGVLFVVLRSGGAKDEALSGQATQVVRLGATFDSRGTPPRQRDGWIIEYEYTADDRRFADSTWLAGSNELDDLDICFDPDDPALHTVRTNDVECGDGPLGRDGRHRAEQLPAG